MEFKEWFKRGVPGQSWEDYLDELIRKGCIVNHTDIEVYMYLAYVAGQKSVKGDK